MSRHLMGVLTPSSNTRLEPLSTAMLAGLPEVSLHVSRFRVVDVGIHSGATSQFDDGHILAAAQLLADARVGVIVWSGTSAGWLGIEVDRVLCARITEATGIPATTSTLALLDALELLGARRLGLVSPYPAEMQDAIVRTFEGEGLRVAAARPLGVTANWDLSEVSVDTLHEQVAEVAAQGPQAVTTFCTNLQAAGLVEVWEARHGLPVLDSTSLAVWDGLRVLGADPSRVHGWGRLFSL